MDNVHLLIVRPDYPTHDPHLLSIINTIRSRCIGWKIETVIVYSFYGAEQYLKFQGEIDLVHIYVPPVRPEKYLSGCNDLASYFARSQIKLPISFERDEKVLRAAMTKYGVETKVGSFEDIVIDHWRHAGPRSRFSVVP